MIAPELWISKFDNLNPLTNEYFRLCLNSTDTGYEKHHILPRSLFPEFIKEPWNIVKLSYQDHYKAHEILAQICIEQNDTHKMVQAWNIICHRGANREFVDAETYACLKLLHKESFTGENNFMFGLIGEAHPQYGTSLSEEHKQKIGLQQIGEKNHNYGKSPSLETRKRMSEAVKKNKVWLGRKHTEESIKKMSEAKLGTNNARFGKKLSEDHKQKLVASRLGKKLSQESIAKRTATRAINKVKKLALQADLDILIENAI